MLNKADGKLQCPHKERGNYTIRVAGGNPASIKEMQTCLKKNQQLENNVTATVNVCRPLRLTVPVNNLGHAIKNVVCTLETSTHSDRGRQGSQSRVV